MTASKLIGLATEKDSQPILDIYAPFINISSITFECDVPPVQEFTDRVKSISSVYPWVVCRMNDCLAGYAYASAHNERKAYQWSVNSSVYIRGEYQRKGIAGALYKTLFELLILLGYYNVYAGITLPNKSSELFHQSVGFKPVGIYHRVGHKLGKWHDVAWYGLSINESRGEPADPLPIRKADSQRIDTILQANIESLYSLL